MPVWRTTDNSWELVLSSYHVDSGLNLGVVARQKHCCQLSLLPAWLCFQHFSSKTDFKLGRQSQLIFKMISHQWVALLPVIPVNTIRS